MDVGRKKMSSQIFISPVGWGSFFKSKTLLTSKFRLQGSSSNYGSFGHSVTDSVNASSYLKKKMIDCKREGEKFEIPNLQVVTRALSRSLLIPSNVVDKKLSLVTLVVFVCVLCQIK